MSLTPEQIADIETKAANAGLDLHQLAREYVLTAAEDLDFGGVGEQFEEQLDLLTPDIDYRDGMVRIHDLANAARVTVTWDDEPNPPYINGDDGYPWLTCGRCDEPLLIAEAGTSLPTMLAEVAAHQCGEAGR